MEQEVEVERTNTAPQHARVEDVSGIEEEQFRSTTPYADEVIMPPMPAEISTQTPQDPTQQFTPTPLQSQITKPSQNQQIIQAPQVRRDFQNSQTRSHDQVVQLSNPTNPNIPPPPSQPLGRPPEPQQAQGLGHNWQHKLQPPTTLGNPLKEGPKETVPINMARDRNRFSVDSFLDVPVTMPIWQLLDRSPQVRAQLARAMASLKPTRRGRRQVTAAVPISKDVPPQIDTEAHEEEDVVCLYIEAWIGSKRVGKTLADTGAVVELINPRLVESLRLQVYEMDEQWTLQLANDDLARVQRYVWALVNVAGVVAMVRAFILGMGDIYDLLLSKRWMRRVRAIEDHGNSTLVIKGKDGHSRLIHGEKTEPVEFKVVRPSVDAWETSLAEEEIARLADELDSLDFDDDHNPTGTGKVSGQ